MQRRPGQPARFGVEVNSPTLELLATLGHDLRGQIYLEGGLSWQHEAETSESSGVAHGRLPRVLQDPEPPHRTGSDRVQADLLGHPAAAHPRRRAAAFITLPSTCTSKPVTYLHVDSYEAPGAFLRLQQRNPGRGDRLQPAGVQPVAVADRGRRRLRPARRGHGGPARAAVHPRTVEAQLARRAGRPGDAPGRPDARSLGARTGWSRAATPSTRKAAAPKPPTSAPCSSNAPGIPDGSLTGGVYVGAPEAGAGPESGGEYRHVPDRHRLPSTGSGCASKAASAQTPRRAV